MKVSFGYNFWMDTVEVTQKEYSDNTGRLPLPDSIQLGRGAEYPVSYVSWYDAILFCNAKSRRYALDTVYSFSGLDTVSSGSAIAMTGLIIHYDRSGWRLPTEAEWEFAAREGSSAIPFPHLLTSAQAETFAWFDVNSSNTTHPVALRVPNAFGLYDMAGNVFEWTGDWKGPYSSVSTANSIGAPNPDGYYEKTLKGGSFKHGYLFLRPSRRAGTYPVTPSTSADFIGFRCCRGAIPGPRYYSAGSAVTGVNQCALVTHDVPGFLGAARAKLAFVNVSGPLRILCVVDFGSPVPAVRQFIDVTDVYDPAISLDGRFVAFCSRAEGFDGPATISIRSVDSMGASPWRISADRAYVPRWWIDPDSRDTFIVYTNSAIDNKSDAWPSTKTFLQKISGGRPVGDPRVIIDEGGFHGGISSLCQYAVTGYTRCITRDLIAKTQWQIFVSPYNGKDATGSTQVCNVSISSDPAHPDRCLFLDFGSQNKISTLVQAAYGIHEYLFIAEMGGNTVAWYKCPDKESAWDYPEWSNKARFAVACCRNASMDAHAVYCLNLEDKTMLRVIEGVELGGPNLWIGAPLDTTVQCGLSADSLGNYGVPVLSGDQVLFSYKMHLFWKQRRNLDIVFVGSSQVYSGIDCAKLPGHKALNMGFSGSGVLSSADIIRNYILPACPRIKLIGISAGIYWLGNPGAEADDSWKAVITQSKGYLYDLHHNFWKDGLSARFDDCIAQAPFLTYFNCDTLGLCLDSCYGWGGTPPDLISGINWDYQLTDTEYINNFNEITKLLQDCADANVQVLMINFPESPAYKNTDHFTLYGPSWEVGRAVVKQLESLESTHSNFHFYDAYSGGNHDYSDAEAINFNHLCSRGAAKLTARVDSLIQTIVQSPSVGRH
jgi:uncharacterized protein (TIGR02171 family)